MRSLIKWSSLLVLLNACQIESPPVQKSELQSLEETVGTTVFNSDVTLTITYYPKDISKFGPHGYVKTIIKPNGMYESETSMNEYISNSSGKLTDKGYINFILQRTPLFDNSFNSFDFYEPENGNPEKIPEYILVLESEGRLKKFHVLANGMTDRLKRIVELAEPAMRPMYAGPIGKVVLE